MTSGSSRVQVRYAETDQMGVAWHGNYLAWFEVGRTDLLRDHGMTYRELEANNLKLPVIEVGVRYLSPALYDDELEVRTRLGEMTGARVRFEYALHRPGEAEPLATGFTVHAGIDGRGRPRRLPQELRRALSEPREACIIAGKEDERDP